MMTIDDLVTYFAEGMPLAITVVVGPTEEEIPDSQIVIQELPGRRFTMDGLAETRTYMTTCIPPAYDTAGAEELAQQVDDLWIKLGGNVIGGQRIIWSDRSSGPAPSENDEGERQPWTGTYRFEIMKTR